MAWFNETPRHCIECNAEIFESMGACLARDVVAFLNGERDSIRERCGVCAARLDFGQEPNATEYESAEAKCRYLDRLTGEETP